MQCGEAIRKATDWASVELRIYVASGLIQEIQGTRDHGAEGT